MVCLYVKILRLNLILNVQYIKFFEFNGFIVFTIYTLCQVWWSPCPSRECPEDEEINLVLDECDDHCLLRDYSKPREENKGVTHIEQSIAVRPPTFITGPTNILQV